MFRSETSQKLRDNLQLLTRKKSRFPGRILCCFSYIQQRRRRRHRFIAYTHQYEREQNMYLSFASLGVVNDLTCLIIIYYVFWAEKTTQPDQAKECVKDPTSDPILSICQMCFFSILRFLASDANKNYGWNHHRKGFIFLFIHLYTTC